MKKLIITGFFCLFSLVIHAALRVQITPSQPSVDSPFKLILTQDDLQNGGIPDLTPLQKDFIILGTERQMNYAIINGQTQSSSEWAITLKAQKEGTVTIPPIKVGGEYTTPTTLQVSTASAAPQNTPNDANPQKNIYLTASSNEKKPYVNQQITYKVTLYNSKHLLDADYQGPQVENALLISLNTEKRYQIQKNNINYLVEEQSYAIFPQKSGPLKIKSPVFTALIYDFNPKRIKVQDKTMTLDVQPIPKAFSGTTWLPAKEIKLTEQYEQSSPTIIQGNTLIRTVSLQGKGIPAQLLPELAFPEIDGVSVYPEQSNDKNQVIQGELIGHTDIKITYLFNKTGTIIIPELKLPWFNIETGKEEIVTLAAKNIEVIASASTSLSNLKPSVATTKYNGSQPSPEIKPPSGINKLSQAWIFAAFFASAWVMTLILWGYQGRDKNSGKKPYKRALDKLHQACMQANPQSARDALLQWAGLHWPDALILNLTDLTRLITDPDLTQQIQILSQILYENNRQVFWHGEGLWDAMMQYRKGNSVSKKDHGSALPPINPS